MTRRIHPVNQGRVETVAQQWFLRLWKYDHVSRTKINQHQ